MSGSDIPLDDAFAKKRRYLRAQAAQESPEERLERFAALQQATFAELRASKHG